MNEILIALNLIMGALGIHYGYYASATLNLGVFFLLINRK